MIQRLKGYLGLAANAGRLISGETNVLKAVQAGKVLRLFLDESAGPNTEDRFTRLGIYHKIPLTRLPHLGEAIGKPSHMIAGLTDPGFEKAIQSIVNENRGGVNEE